MPKVLCKKCGKKFYAKPNWILLGYGKYCSIKCRSESLKTGKKVTCFICNKEVYKTQKALKGSKSGKFFCSKSCQTVWRNSVVYIGKNHPNWKEGEFVSYRNILIKNGRSRKCTLCNIEDKRILAVHHIDRNRRNNSAENLSWLCHNCHFLIHHYKKEEDRFLNILKQKSIGGRSSSNG